MGVFKHLLDKAYVTYHLHRLASETDVYVWDKSVTALAEVGFPAVPALVDALRNANPMVRQGAAEALGQIAEKNPGNARTMDVVPALHVAMADEVPEVRQWAAFALCVIAVENPGNAEVVNIVHVLVDAMKGGDSAVRLGAAYQLGEIAQTAPETFHAVVSVLIEALNDGDKIVREDASWALSGIIRGNSEIESLTLIDQKLKEGVALLVKGSTSKDGVRDAMMNIAGFINEVAARRNELSSKAMENDGLMLAGERPKPPKKDEGMYHIARKQAARCG